MHQQNLAILKGLVCVAWADGRVVAAERELIEALIQAFSATPSEALEVRHFAEQPRTLEDVPIHELSYNDRRVLLTQAVLLSFVDGEQSAHEKALIDELCKVLRIPNIEADGIVSAAERQASELVPLLQS
jgi:tellurite resistance protein